MAEGHQPTLFKRAVVGASPAFLFPASNVPAFIHGGQQTPPRLSMLATGDGEHRPRTAALIKTKSSPIRARVRLFFSKLFFQMSFFFGFR